jgi:hypothetical protein
LVLFHARLKALSGKKKTSVARIIFRYLITRLKNQHLNKKIKLFLFLFLLPSPAFCHEFWLEPSLNDARKMAEFSMLVGESFRGETLPYIKENLVSSYIIDKLGIRKLSGYDGDDPAFNIARIDRNYGISISTQYSKTTFEKSEVFHAYILKEGLAGDLVNFKFASPIEEHYARHSKFFWGSDPALEHAKHIFGQRIEFIFSARICRRKRDILIFQLLKGGRAFSLRPVFVTDAVAKPKRKKVFTDKIGLFEVELAGNGGFLINSVVIFEDKKTRKLRSDWASIRISNIQNKCNK